MSDKPTAVDAPQQLGVTENGDWEYPSGSRSGYTEIELPSLPGSINPSERLLTKDFGTLVAGKIESSMQGTYLKVGRPQQGPVATFRHYLGCAQGASLMGAETLKRMETLATELEKEPEKQAYFEQVVKPWLLTLAPRRR
ncbi:MAG: hypothetical protein ABSC64_20735 [Candidatus Korobacteraceae bacterium]|jgi:hypothetical protein